MLKPLTVSDRYGISGLASWLDGECINELTLSVTSDESKVAISNIQCDGDSITARFDKVGDATGTVKICWEYHTLETDRACKFETKITLAKVEK